MNDTKATKTKTNRMGEEDLSKKYPQVVPGSLRFLQNENKQAVKVNCIEDECQNTREVRTSDLFQVTRCVPCTAKARTERAKAKRAEKKAAKAE